MNVKALSVFMSFTGAMAFVFVKHVLKVEKEKTDLADSVYSLEIENKLLKRQLERIKKSNV